MSDHDCNLKMDEFCCVCVAEEIEAKDKRIAELEAIIYRNCDPMAAVDGDAKVIYAIAAGQEVSDE